MFAGTVLVGRNTGINEAPGFRGYPCLSEAFKTGCLVNDLPELSEQAVHTVRGQRRLDGET